MTAMSPELPRAVERRKKSAKERRQQKESIARHLGFLVNAARSLDHRGSVPTQGLRDLAVGISGLQPAAPRMQAKTIRCWYFPYGQCIYGDGCRFSHSFDLTSTLPAAGTVETGSQFDQPNVPPVTSISPGAFGRPSAADVSCLTVEPMAPVGIVGTGARGEERNDGEHFAVAANIVDATSPDGDHSEDDTVFDPVDFDGKIPTVATNWMAEVSKEATTLQFEQAHDDQLPPVETLSSVSPLCTCRLPSIQLVVRKAGPNMGRMFWLCGNSEGQRCPFFQWLDEPHVVAERLQDG